MKKMKRVTRYDTCPDPGFSKRLEQARAARDAQAHYVTPSEAERQLTDTGAQSGAEAARLRMLERHGITKGRMSSDEARKRMIERRGRAQ